MSYAFGIGSHAMVAGKEDKGNESRISTLTGIRYLLALVIRLFGHWCQLRSQFAVMTDCTSS